ncbi:LysR family transcriptional regulator [Fictibacillus fluitans]|uniref:LysR family transcriptional regulator n=1 Tax=Fictibacillus fluitans TaxID=3058422 RepID=A0ABT8HWF8_9BACL|nr:LysR family transcriptional regulator [Fictibacillus sp. NE201]MDN4525115.1 LysR family transcriptional regulator [Fictibacillus sp. NE201]
MDINQLKAFEHVVRLGSFSKAARYLNLSQPTISIRIQGLEKEVGGGLFYRVGKRIELTEAGKGFLPYARQAIEILTKGMERAQLMQEGKSGFVTIGTLPSYTSGTFSSVIAYLNKNYSEIKLEIHTGHNQQIIEMLYDGFIKMGFMTKPYFNTDIKSIFTFKEPLVLVAHPSHHLASTNRTLSCADMIKNSQPYIIVDWSEESKHWQKSLLSPRIDHLELPPATALDLVFSNNGIALLTESMVTEQLKDKKLVKLQPADLPALYREMALVSLESEQSLSPTAMRFVDAFRKQFNKVD